MVRLCSALVTALTGLDPPEHPPSATPSAAHPRTPRYTSLALPLRTTTLRQNTVLSARSAGLARLRAPLDPPPSFVTPSSLLSPVGGGAFGSRGCAFGATPPARAR